MEEAKHQGIMCSVKETGKSNNFGENFCLHFFDFSKNGNTTSISIYGTNNNYLSAERKCFLRL